MAKQIGSLGNGAVVQMLTLWGKPVQWIVAGQNVYSGQTTLVSRYIIALMAMQAKGASAVLPNNRRYATLFQWINSSAGAGQWWSAQQPGDKEPSGSNVTCNPYASLPGMLYESRNERRPGCLATDNMLGTGSFSFLMPGHLGFSDPHNAPRLPGLRNADCTCTQECLSRFTGGPSDTSTNWKFWLLNGYYAQDRLSSTQYASLDDGTIGVRPWTNVSQTCLVSDGSPHVFVFNEPPTSPPTIYVPELIFAEASTTITWDEATDPEGATVGYTLQRDIDAHNSFTQVYQGIERTYQDSVERGTTQVQYRVQAYDPEGATSGWTTSEVREVNNNQPPVVQLNDVDNANPTKDAPKANYTVTDEDSESVTVTTYLDNEKLSVGAAELGMQKEITLTPDKWLITLNGEHAYKVEAVDDQGASASAETKFTKAIESVDMQLKEPLTADDRPTQMILNVSGAFPMGCDFRIEVCNNGNDEEPTWIDATRDAQNGTKIYFANDTKTANDWGVGIKVHLARNDAVGDCYLFAISGNFA